MADLYDHLLAFYVWGCFTDGKFDAEKAAAMGYNEAQLPVIEKYLADNPDGVKAAQKVAEDYAAATAPPAEAEPVAEEPPAEG